MLKADFFYRAYKYHDIGSILILRTHVPMSSSRYSFSQFLQKLIPKNDTESSLFLKQICISKSFAHITLMSYELKNCQWALFSGGILTKIRGDFSGMLLIVKICRCFAAMPRPLPLAFCKAKKGRGT